MLGWQFTKYQKAEGQSKFDELFTLFQELLVYSSGNVSMLSSGLWRWTESII